MKLSIPIIVIFVLSVSNCLAIDAVYDGTNGIKAQVFSNCLGCHSSDLSGSSRNGAPTSVNFDNYQLALSSAERAVLRGAGGSMPPFGNEPLNEEQKNALLAWQDADFPEAEIIMATPTPEPTPIPTATPEPTPSLELAHLATGILLKLSNGETEPFSSTSFNAAVISHDEIKTSPFNDNENLEIKGQIVVASSHQGQLADIILVAGYKGGNNNEQFYQKDIDNNFVTWDGNPLTLKANQSQVSLTSLYDVSVYSGPLFSGIFRIFIAYRLANSQEIVFNATALEFEVINMQ